MVLNLETPIGFSRGPACVCTGGGGSGAGPWRVPDCQQQVSSGSLALQPCDKGGLSFQQVTCPRLGQARARGEPRGSEGPTDQTWCSPVSSKQLPTAAVPELFPLGSPQPPALGHRSLPTLLILCPSSPPHPRPYLEVGAPLKAVRALCFSPSFCIRV